jgi:hypothetical protein
MKIPVFIIVLSNGFKIIGDVKLARKSIPAEAIVS